MKYILVICIPFSFICLVNLLDNSLIFFVHSLDITDHAFGFESISLINNSLYGLLYFTILYNSKKA